MHRSKYIDCWSLKQGPGKWVGRMSVLIICALSNYNRSARQAHIGNMHIAYITKLSMRSSKMTLCVTCIEIESNTLRLSVAVEFSKAKSLNFPWLNFLEAALEVLQLFVGHLLIHDDDGSGGSDVVLVIAHLFHPKHESQGLKVHPTSVPLIKVVLKKYSLKIFYSPSGF